MPKLQEELVSLPILSLPNASRKYTLDTDVYKMQVRCVLLKGQPDKTSKPIGYWLQSLTKFEQTYDTTQRECFTIVRSLLMLRPYLVGTRFKIRADHDSLKRILSLADTAGCLAGWQLRLSKFNFDVVHCDGIKHQAKDASSHLITTGITQTHRKRLTSRSTWNDAGK